MKIYEQYCLIEQKPLTGNFVNNYSFAFLSLHIEQLI
jgi:hypothetical protein